MPETGHTEYLPATTPKSLWNEFLIKYLSGIASFELLNKYGLLKTDGKLNFTDGLDKAVNASKVFSNAGKYGHGDKRRGMIRRNRQVTPSPNSVDTKHFEEIKTKIPNWRGKRRLKLFSNIKGKLKALLRRPQPMKLTTLTNSSKLNKEENNKTAENTEIEESKVTGEVEEGIKSSVNDVDVDRLLREASTSDEDYTLDNEGITNVRIDEKVTASLLNNAEFPDLTSPEVPEIILAEDDINIDSKEGDHQETSKPNSPIISQYNRKNLFDDKKIRFVIPLLNFKQRYEKHGTRSSTQKSKVSTLNHFTKTSETKVGKRELGSSSSFTAKNVAAIEVVVDLVKNNVNYGEALTDIPQMNNLTTAPYSTPTTTTTTTLITSTAETNAIQLHIAIPYNLQLENKRSVDPMRLRRVFAAKMFTPVDMEYQVLVQTLEDINSSLPPTIYLLKDPNGYSANGNFLSKARKDVTSVNSKIKPRQLVNANKVFATEKVETTSNKKNLGKVTLSKDFVAAINKHLVQLYENLTAINESALQHNVRVRNTEPLERPHTMNKVKSHRRHLNWEAVKKYFGHDRVCHCKCRPNKTMCRACAASNHVISELIFEFDNLAQYMKDHCTEIQTFFWMNPSGGKKLMDAVHKVDQTLHDYSKRVKGKCKGRPCSALSTYIDKRYLVKKKKIPKKYIGGPLISDLRTLAADIETASKFININMTDNLEKREHDLVSIISNCIKDVAKRDSSLKAKRAKVKSLYALDNINVNIICKPSSDVAVSSSTNVDHASSSKYAEYVTTSAACFGTDIPDQTLGPYDYELENIVVTKRKGLSRLFPKKKLRKYKINNIFNHYVSEDSNSISSMRTHKKRQTADQIESPLISDTGGAFWHDYLKGNTLVSRLMVNSNIKATTPITTVLTRANTSPKTVIYINEKQPESEENDKTIALKSNLRKYVFPREVNSNDYSSIDTLTYNINELFKIFHNLTDLNEIKNLSTNSENKEKTKTCNTNYTSVPQKETSKTTKVYKKLKAKLHLKHRPTTNKSVSTDLTTPVPKPTPVCKEKSKKEESTETPVRLSTKTTTIDQTSSAPTIKSTKSKTTKMTTTTAEVSTSTNKKAKTSPTIITDKSTTSEHRKEDLTSSTEGNLKTSNELEASNEDELKTSNEEELEIFNTESTEVNLEKTVTKSYFFDKFRKATFAFFKGKIKVHKENTSESLADIARKLRSPSTENINETTEPIRVKNPAKANHTTTTPQFLRTTLKNPTILIIDEYDTEMALPLDHKLSKNEKKVDYGDKNNDKNFRSLLLSILGYEANQLNAEWDRLKSNQLDRPYFAYIAAGNNKRSTFENRYPKLEKPTHKSGDVVYDVLKELEELEIPTPKSLEQEEKETKKNFSDKFKYWIVPTPNPLKPESPEKKAKKKKTKPVKTTKAATTMIVPTTAKTTTTKSVTAKTTKAEPTTTKTTTAKTKRTTTPSKAPKIALGEESPSEKSIFDDKSIYEIPTTSKILSKTTNKLTSKLNPKYTTMPMPTQHSTSTEEDSHVETEAVDSNPVKRLCDIDATYKHVLKRQELLSKEDFEKYVANLTCYKYKNSPKYYVINLNTAIENVPKNIKLKVNGKDTKTALKWDWIRNKRSLLLKTDSKQEESVNNEVEKSLSSISQRATEENDKTSTKFNKPKTPFNFLKAATKKQLKDEDTDLIKINKANFVTEDGEYFETFYRDEFGIYRNRKKRRKRAPNGIYNLDTVLNNADTVLPYENKLNGTYVMKGDSVIIHCTVNETKCQDVDLDKIMWKTNRPEMLINNNVAVKGDTVFIKDVNAKNMGTYICQRGALQKSLDLTVEALPTFRLVSALVYSLEDCSYDVLKAIQSLSSVMTKYFCSEDQHFSVALKDPVCLKNTVDGSDYVRVTAVTEVTPHIAVRHNGQCRRDLHRSLALLAVANWSVLASVPVVILDMRNGNKILVPSKPVDIGDTIVTHSLRGKDSWARDLHRYADLAPGSVKFIESCPAGYHLMAEQKICVACPVDSWAQKGESACTRALARSSTGSRHKRSGWWWYPGCGYCAAWWAIACVCAAVAALVHSRRPRTVVGCADGPCGNMGGVMTMNTALTQSPRARPLSPSRVILAKFFRGSRSSTKATDSQETKFMLRRDQKPPPPLPPIDFDF